MIYIFSLPIIFFRQIDYQYKLYKKMFTNKENLLRSRSKDSKTKKIIEKNLQIPFSRVKTDKKRTLKIEMIWKDNIKS